MKSSANTQSATSLPRAPRDDASRRSRNYLVTMGIRIACFALMVLITPYGWYTWILGAGAVFLPYIAVVIANVGEDVHTVEAERPERALTQAPEPVDAPVTEASEPPVILIQETLPIDRADDSAARQAGPDA